MGNGAAAAAAAATRPTVGAAAATGRIGRADGAIACRNDRLGSAWAEGIGLGVRYVGVRCSSISSASASGLLAKFVRASDDASHSHFLSANTKLPRGQLTGPTPTRRNVRKRAIFHSYPPLLPCP